MAIFPRSQLRVMVDTTILVAGSGWPRWPYEVLRSGLNGECVLVLSPYVIYEARGVLSKRFPQFLTRFERYVAATEFELIADPTVEEVALNLKLMRDENDVPIALAAINAGVDYFVSEDKDFTARDETTVRLHQRLNVRLSGTFLREVLGWSSDELEQVRQRMWSDVVDMD